jgi:putrescine transport system permease protein
MVIYSKVKLGLSPDVNALATLILVAIGTCIVVGNYLMRRGERRA